MIGIQLFGNRFELTSLIKHPLALVVRRKLEYLFLLKNVRSFSLLRLNDPKPEKTSLFVILLRILIDLDSKKDLISKNL